MKFFLITLFSFFDDQEKYNVSSDSEHLMGPIDWYIFARYCKIKKNLHLKNHDNFTSVLKISRQIPLIKGIFFK